MALENEFADSSLHLVRWRKRARSQLIVGEVDESMKSGLVFNFACRGIFRWVDEFVVE